MLPSVNSSYWSRKRFFIRPLVLINSSKNRRVLKPKFGTPLLEALCFSKIRDLSRGCPVVALNLISSPSAVILGVAKVIFNSITGMVWGRTRTHIGKEVSEIKPAIANTNSCPAVLGIGATGRAGATFLDSTPDKVFWPHIIPSCVTMLKTLGGSCLFSDAATRERLPSKHIFLANDSLVAARAHTFPLGLSIWGFIGTGDNGEATKNLAREFFDLIIRFHNKQDHNQAYD